MPRESDKMKNREKFGIGTDIEEVERFKRIVRSKQRLKKIFSSKEIIYSMRQKYPERHLAVRFAGKEAIIKALANLSINDQFELCDIEILRRKNGLPYVDLSKSYKRDLIFQISLSHCGELALAFAVVFKRN